MLFRNEYGEPRFQVRLRLLFVLTAMACGTLAFRHEPWLVAAIGAAITEVYLHSRTTGKTSPFAAAAFVVCGPVLGVAAAIVRAQIQAERMQGGWSPAKGQLERQLMIFSAKMLIIGLVAGALVALTLTFFKRDEWLEENEW